MELATRIKVSIALNQLHNMAQASMVRCPKLPYKPISQSGSKTVVVVVQMRNLSLGLRQHLAPHCTPADRLTSTRPDRQMQQQEVVEVPDMQVRASLHLCPHLPSHASAPHHHPSIPVTPAAGTGAAEANRVAHTGLEVEAQVRCGTGVEVRISMADVHRLLSVTEVAAGQIAALALLAARVAPYTAATSSWTDAAVGHAGVTHPGLGAYGRDSKGVGVTTQGALRSISNPSPAGRVEWGDIDWAGEVLDSWTRSSFKADGLRMVLLESRQGGALGLIRLPLFACHLEAVEFTGQQQVPTCCAEGAQAQEEAAHEVVSGAVNASVDVSYFNRTLAVWEPFFERSSLGVQATLNTTVRQVVAGIKPKLAVRLSGKEVINVNISTALVDLLATTVKHASTHLPHQRPSRSAASSSASQTQSSGTAFHPLWVRNQLGHTIVLRCGQEQQMVGVDTKTRVTCVPLVQSGGMLDGLPMLAASSVAVELAGEAGNGVGAAVGGSVHVKLDVIGRQVYTLSLPLSLSLASAQPHTVLAMHDVKVVVDVMVEEGGGSKLILMRSPLMICNHLKRPLEIMFADTLPGQGPTMAGRTRCIIAAQGSMMVPVQHMDNRDGFSLRPYTHPAQLPSDAPEAACGGGAGWEGKHAAKSAHAAKYGSTKHPGYRWRTGESLMCREWRSRTQLTHFKALGMHGLPLSAVLQWDTDEPSAGVQTHATLWRLSLHPALTIENVLPCDMSARITTCLHSDPPSPRGPTGSLWSIDVPTEECCPVLDRHMTPGTYMWVSVKVPNFSWSQPVLLRDGLSGEAATTDGGPEGHDGGGVGWMQTCLSHEPPPAAHLAHQGCHKLRLRGARKRVLHLELEVRVDAHGTCNVVVYAPYWIVNRTNQEALVRVAPSIAIGAADSIQSLVTVPALPLQGVEDHLVSSAHPDGGSLYVQGASGLMPGHMVRSASSGLHLSSLSPDNMLVAAGAASGQVLGVGGARGMDGSAGESRAEPLKGLALLADLDMLDDYDDLEALTPSDTAAPSKTAPHLYQPAAVSVAARTRIVNSSEEEEEDDEMGQGSHVKLFSLNSSELSSDSEWVKSGVQRSGVQIRLACTGWSEIVAVTGTSAIDTGKLNLRYAPRQAAGLARLNRSVQLGVSIGSAPGRFHRTKTITLTPRYVLVNQLGVAVQVRQEATAHTITVPPAPCPPIHATTAYLATNTRTGGDGARLSSNRVVWHWTDARKSQNIQVAMALVPCTSSSAGVQEQEAWRSEERWSGSVDLDGLADSVIMLPAPLVHAGGKATRRQDDCGTARTSGQEHGIIYVDVRVRRCKGTITVVLRRSRPNEAPYWIDNFSPYTLRIYQKEVSTKQLYLRSYQGMPYAWQSALGDSSKHALVVEVEGSWPVVAGYLQLDRVGHHKPIFKAGHVMLYVSVRCDGPTLTLTICDAQIHPNTNLLSTFASATMPTTAQGGTPAHPAGAAPATRQRSQLQASPHGMPIDGTSPSDGINASSMLPAPRAGGVGTWMTQVDMKLVGIGVSVVESEKPRELLYLWLGAEPSVAFSDKQEGLVSSDSSGAHGGLSLSLWSTPQEHGLALKIRCVQVDNLSASAAYPVVLSRSRASYLSGHTASLDTFALTIARNSFVGSSIQVL